MQIIPRGVCIMPKKQALTYTQSQCHERGLGGTSKITNFFLALYCICPPRTSVPWLKVPHTDQNGKVVVVWTVVWQTQIILSYTQFPSRDWLPNQPTIKSKTKKPHNLLWIFAPFWSCLQDLRIKGRGQKGLQMNSGLACYECANYNFGLSDDLQQLPFPATQNRLQALPSALSKKGPAQGDLNSLLA